MIALVKGDIPDNRVLKDILEIYIQSNGRTLLLYGFVPATPQN